MVRTLPLGLALAACTPQALPARDGDSPHTRPTTPRDQHETSPYDPPTGPTGATSDGDCPDGVVCVDQLPFVHQASTSDGASALEGYACSPDTDEGGPEVVYRVEIEERGFFAATLSGIGAGVDIDVHLLSSLDPADCLDRGHWEAARWLEPGTWWVVADTWVDGEGVALDGEYSLRLDQVLPADLAARGLDPEVLGRGLWAFDRAWQEQDATRLRLAVGDFDLPSDERRFWLVDLADGAVLAEEYVSHGEGSSDEDDPRIVAAMSNIEGSHMSSVGVMRASETYIGEHGLSMHFDGLEPGFDDQVRARAIVLHNADYATEDFVEDYGYLGQSWGCAVLDPDVSEAVIEALTDGGLFLSHFSDPAWLAASRYVGDW